MSAKSKAMRIRNPPDVRLRACAAQVRNIARYAPMPAGTRNRLHAIAHTIDEILDGVQQGQDPPTIIWTGERDE